MLRRALGLLGLPSEPVLGAAALLRQAGRRRPKAVLCSSRLAGGGIAVCAALCVLHPGLAVCLIAEDHDEARRARAAGLTLVLVKPFGLDDLKTAFRGLVRSRRSRLASHVDVLIGPS